MFTRMVMGMALLGIMAAVASAATVVAYEGFNYAAGAYLATDSSTGQTGGSGWADSWKLTYYDGRLQAASSGYTYPNLSTVGNRITFGTGGSQGISQAYRALPTMMDSNIAYVQCLFYSSVSGTGGTPQLRLENSTSGTTGAMGLHSTVSTNLLAIMAGAETAYSSTSRGGVNLMVWQIDYENTTSKLWIDPDLSSFDYDDPQATPDVTADFAPEFDGLSIYFRPGSALDEIRVLYVPEPATMLVMAAGLPVLLKRRRRRG